MSFAACGDQVVGKAQEGDKRGGRWLPDSSVTRPSPIIRSQSVIGGDGINRLGARQSAKQRQHHLYLVFDDWCRGYSIRKVSLSHRSRGHQRTAVSGQDPLLAREAEHAASLSPVRRLPLPLVRLVAPRCYPNYFVSAFGSRILAMHPTDPLDDSPENYFPMFDVRSLGITFGPAKEHPINHIYFPVGKKLFTLSETSFEMLHLNHIIYPKDAYCSMDLNLNWSWTKLSRQPFNVDDVTSYCLHPNRRTFLVSTKMDATVATYAFDTKSLSWKLLGSWALPFAGRGHFDSHLEAFVGLSKDPATLGQLYTCDVPRTDRQCPAPASKLCREKLFSEDPAERHVSATLVYMECLGKFCLVQCVSIDDESAEDVCPPGRCFYRVATFFVTHERNGDLMTCTSLQVQYYEVPEATSKLFLAEDPVAFWM